MDFSDDYQLDKTKCKKCNLDKKLLWTRQAQESFELGKKAYHKGKTIGQHPVPDYIIKRLLNMQKKDGVNSAYCNNTQWWKRGWKEAYRNNLVTKMNKKTTLSGLDLIRVVRKESLDLPTNSYTRLLDEFSLESFSAASLSDMQTSKLQQLLDKIREINKQ